MNATSVLAIILVLVGCCSNVVFLELIVKEFPGSGNIITFAQFLFIAVEGFFFHTRFLTKPNVIPISKYVTMVCLFFSVSVVNNYALNFNIPLPLHIVFRAGSLLANMALGVLILKKEYPLSKYISVVMISAGIFVCTFMSARNVAKEVDKFSGDDLLYEYARMAVGVFMLTFAMLMSAYMGIYQETLYKEHGKHPKEALFYSHALPLPGFLMVAADIWNHTVLFSQSAPIDVASGLSIPSMWLYLLGNVVTQYVCIRGVFILTTECPSLVVTLIITLRKFISLVFSILYFRNPFTLLHWIGTFSVFIGVFLFSGVLHTLYNSVLGPKEKEVAKKAK